MTENQINSDSFALRHSTAIRVISTGTIGVGIVGAIGAATILATFAMPLSLFIGVPVVLAGGALIISGAIGWYATARKTHEVAVPVLRTDSPVSKPAPPLVEPTLEFPASSPYRSYTGEHRQGTAHGQGTLIYKNGNVAQGHFEEGLLNGQGRVKLHTGAVFQGNFKDGKLQGQGTATYSDRDPNDSYIGEFQDGLPHGQGTLTSKSGEINQGNFQNGKLQGQGTKTYSIGDSRKSYSGEFQDGIPHGQGTLTLKGGKGVFQGNYVQGRLNGVASFTYSESNPRKIYTGQFTERGAQGTGKVIYKNGEEAFEEFSVTVRDEGLNFDFTGSFVPNVICGVISSSECQTVNFRPNIPLPNNLTPDDHGIDPFSGRPGLC